MRENVTRLELEDGISAGILWSSLGPDVVPLFEEHSARLERGILLKEWYALDPMERAIIVAVRRIETAARNQQAEAEIKDARRRAKKRQ